MTWSLCPGHVRRRPAVVGLSSLAIIGCGLFEPAMGQEFAGGTKDDARISEDVETSEPTLPGPDAIVALRSLEGEWEMAGTTHRETGEAPAGSSFAARQTARWEVPGRVLRVDWTVMDGYGAVIGDGRSRIAYDEIASAVVNTYAGRDRDTRFSGSATLIDASDGVLEWRGHETRGLAASVNFEVTYLFPDASTCTVDFIPTCVDGELGPRPSRFTWQRRNSFLSAVPFADRLIGEWPVMDDLATRSRIRFGPGRRSLVIESVSASEGDAEAASMLETLWFDPGSDRLRYRGHRRDGAWMEGVAVSDPETGALEIEWRGFDRFGEPEVGRLQLSTSDRHLVRDLRDVQVSASDVTGADGSESNAAESAASGTVASYGIDETP